MKKAQIKRSWVVYPPNYKPGDGYFKIPFLKDAWNKACSLGEGSYIRLDIEKIYRNGNSRWTSGSLHYIVGNIK